MIRTALALLALILFAAPGYAGDSRLAQKVTYYGGHQRLHTVAEELTQQTGVTIRCGSNLQDWRVRDIPVIVCVKDMPLGKLLERVTQCTHVRLVAEKVTGEAEDEIAYRLCRNRTLADDVQIQLDYFAEANKKLSLWAWDTLLAYADMPDAAADIPTKDYEGILKIDAEQIRLLGQTLKALGPDARAQAAAGEPVKVRITDSPAYGALFDYAMKHPGPEMRGAAPIQPTLAERADAMLAMRIMRTEDGDADGGFDFYAYGIPARADPNDNTREWHAWEARPVLSAKVLADVKKLKLPPPPDVDAALASDEQFPDPALRLLKTDDDWKAQVLQKKIRLELPQTKKTYFTRAEALTALAKAADADIICEDFDSQMLPLYWAVRIDPKSEGTLGDLLKEIDPLSNLHWFINPDAKLVVGWADNWRKRHQALVADSFVSGLHEKMERSELEVDDMAPLWNLTKDQLRDWFSETPDYTGIACDSIMDYGTGIWRLYSALGAEDKALAKSPDGLPLAKLDPQWVIDLLKRSQEESERNVLVFAMPTQTPREKERERYMSDPAMIGRLTLKVTPKPLESWSIRPIGEDGTTDIQEVVSGTDGPFKHTYVISLTDRRAETDRLYWKIQWFGAVFPIYTAEHEAELRKKAQPNPAGK